MNLNLYVAMLNVYAEEYGFKSSVITENLDQAASLMVDKTSNEVAPGAIKIDKSMIIKSAAFRDDMLDSDVLTLNYTVLGSENQNSSSGNLK